MFNKNREKLYNSALIPLMCVIYMVWFLLFQLASPSLTLIVFSFGCKIGDRCQCSIIFQDFMMEKYKVMLHIINFWCLEIPYVFLYENMFFLLFLLLLRNTYSKYREVQFSVDTVVTNLLTFLTIFF